METGNIIQINGRFGFEINPTKEVVKIHGGLVTLRTYPNKTGGLLSHLNESIHGIDMLGGRFTVIK